MTLNVDTISDVHTYGLDTKSREIYLHGYVATCAEAPGED